MILREFEIVSIVELAKYIFADAPDIVPVIIILHKTEEKKIERNIIQTASFSNKTSLNLNDFVDITYKKVSQKDIASNTSKIFNLNLIPKVKELLEKIKINSIELSEFSSVSINYGIKTGNNAKFVMPKKTSENLKKCLKTKEITRYRIQWNNLWLDYGSELAGYRKTSLEVPKIIIQYIRKLSMRRRLICGLDEVGEYYPLNNYSYITGNENELEILLGILNSKLINFYFANSFIDYNIKPTYISKLPVKMGSIEDKTKLCNKVKKMLFLNNRLNEIGNKLTDERTKIEGEIRKTDDEIDTLVYEVYGITEAEKKIIEDSLK